MGVRITGLVDVSKQIDKVMDLSTPLNRSANRGSRDFKTITSNEIREKINLKKSYVDKGLKTRIKTASQRDQTIGITVYAQDRGALLSNFMKGKVTKKGAVIEITKGKPHRIGRAFEITLKQGVRAVVWRKNKNKAHRNFVTDGAFAIHGPSPSQIMNQKRDVIKEKGAESLAKTINHNIKRHLDGK